MADSRSELQVELVRRGLGDALSSLTEDLRENALRRVVALVEADVTRERERCRRLCLHRAELWEKTPAARHPSLEAARQEARARQNEARYLADLIESGDDLFAEPDA